MKLDKKSKIFIIVFFSIILISAIIIGSINYAKEQELKNKIEDSKSTRTLTLNNISTAITLDELFKIEMSKEYTTDNDVSVNNEKMTKITYTNTTFYGADCEKEYVFYNNTLGLCIFDIDTSHWMPKDIYEELVKINGEPDKMELKSDKLGTDYYTWYGKNGTLTMCDDNISNNIEIVFELEEQ